MNGGGGRAPITIGINPTIAFYSIVLGGACALAAYTEKYRRDQDEIDDRLKERYFTNVKEQQAKMPLITQTIRGQDARLDDAMNKWVWGGKADLSGPTTTTSAGSGGGGGNTSKTTLSVKSYDDDDEPSSSEEDDLDSSSSSDSSDSDSASSSSSSSSSSTEEELEQEKKLSKKERRQRRKERKQRREARRKKREEEKRRLEAERETLVFQSVAAGVAVGAVAVVVTMLVGNGRK